MQVRQQPDVAQGKDVHHSAGSEARGMHTEGRMTGKEKSERDSFDASKIVERNTSMVTSWPGTLILYLVYYTSWKQMLNR